MKFKDLKIGSKIMVGFGVVAFITLIVGLVGYFGVNRISRSFSVVSEVRMPSIQYLKEMELGFTDYMVAQRTLLNPNLSDEEKAVQFQNIANARNRYRKAIELFTPLEQTEQEAAIWEQLLSKMDEWRMVNEEFEGLAEEISEVDIFYPMEFLKDLETFQGDHYNLQVKVANTIRDGRLFEGGEDHMDCNLGHWLPSVTTNNPTIKQALASLSGPHQRFHEAVHHVKRLVNNGNYNAAWEVYESEMITSAKDVFANFDVAIEEAQRAVELFEKAENTALHASKEKQEEAMALMGQIIQINENIAEQAVKNSDQAVTTATASVITGIVIGLVIAVLLGILITRMISSGITRGVGFAKEIANGNLTAEIEDQYLERKDEIGQLGNALQGMVNKLKDIVENILNGSESISGASGEMASTSQELSQGASEQAASVEQVSSSMEEMVSNIQQNTDNAQQTEKIAMNAVQGIREGSSATNTAVEAMKNIADKIKIINDIAFQTNILALNAAVEAARAGEHGKGFAVVAAEVRKLAERSKIAADEIDDLSASGVGIAEKAGIKLNEMVPEIEKTAKLVQEIAAASIEQNSGADQINNAIQQLNSITQQNAGASEELATSAEELSGQSDQLRDTIMYFKVDRMKKIQGQMPKRIKAGQLEKKEKVKKTQGAAIEMKEFQMDDTEFEKF